MPREIRIFISQAPEDANLVTPLRQILTAWQLPYAENGLIRGSSKVRAPDVQGYLAAATVFLRICTAAAPRSYWMGLERNAFLSLQSEDFRAGQPANRLLINLILDKGYE